MSEKDFENSREQDNTQQNTNTKTSHSDNEIASEMANKTAAPVQKSIELGKKASKKIGKNIMKKALKNILKKATKLIAQLLIKLGMLIAEFAVPILIVTIALAVIAFFAFDISFDSKGKEAEYQDESITYDNPKKQSKEGEDYVNTNLSSGNKVVKSFYAYYSQKSYFKKIGSQIYRADDKRVENVIDKYNREKNFMLSPDFLWSLDSHLHNDKFKYPEQFIKPVYYDKKKFTLKSLTDKNENLVVKSQKYDSKGLAVKGEKELGVWDYGFAPILNYKRYKEDQEKRGHLVEEEVWDKEAQAFVTQKVKNGAKYTEKVPGYPKYVWMIDKIVSSVGDIKNKIQCKWEDSGEEFTTVKSVSVSVPVRHTETVKEKERDENGKVIKDKDGNPKTTTHQVTVYRNESRTAKQTYKGTLWKKEAKYVGEPDTSGIIGSKYMEDYMYHYDTRIPKNVMSGFDLERRTGKSIKGLESILKDVDETMNADSDYDNAGSSDESSDLSTTAKNISGGTEKFKRAMQYFDVFNKYGEAYGVDPYLLAAICAQESGGNPAIDTSRYGSVGVGLMQITASTGRANFTALNYKTGKSESFKLNSASDFTPENSARFAAMYLQYLASRNEYNVALTVQSYWTAPVAAIQRVASEKGISYSAVQKDASNTDWLKYAASDGGDGKKYVQRILEHYANNDGHKPYVIDKKGTKHELGGKVEVNSVVVKDTGETSSSSGGGFSISSILNVLKEKWNELFPDAPAEYSKVHKRYDGRQIGNDPLDIVNMSFSMTEKKNFSEYEYLTVDDWKEKYKLLFSDPDETGAGSGDSNTDGSDELANQAEIDKYFPNGYTDPLSKVKIASSYDGTDTKLKASKGAKVMAFAEGKVVAVTNNSVTIDHGTGATTTYTNLKKVTVKKNDKVEKGATIGSANGNIGFAMHYDGKVTDSSWPFTEGMVSSSGYIPPVSGHITSPFGWRNLGFGREFHYGVDLSASVGTPVKAAANGVVTWASPMGTYGNFVKVKHNINGKTMTTCYAHLSKYAVHVGQTVKQGQVIAYTGMTGRTFGPHLHFEVHNGTGHYKDGALDPAKYVKLPR